MTDTQSTEKTHESERPDVVDFAGFAGETPPKRVKTGRGSKVVATAACGVAAFALAASFGVYQNTHSQLASALRKQHAAEAKPPKIVEKKITVLQDVPIFGRSVMMGVYASGTIQAGGLYTGGAGVSYTPDDSTCSGEYTQLSGVYTQFAIDRDLFMGACQNSLTTTLKKDDTP